MKYRILLSVLIFAGVLCKAEPTPKDTILTSSVVRLEESDLDKMAGIDFRKRLIGQIPGQQTSDQHGLPVMRCLSLRRDGAPSHALLTVCLFRSLSLFLNLIRSRASNMLQT